MTQDKSWVSFGGGRYTRGSLLATSQDHCLIAQNLIFPGDRVARKRPGYTNLATLPCIPAKFFDFHRQSDGVQKVFINGAGYIGYMNPDGTGYTTLSSGEAGGTFEFTTNVFALFCNNATSAYSIVDVAGTWTKRKWGIAAPSSAPTIATGAGTMTLTSGRQYCFAYVSKWTDNQGVSRMHIGPPSPLSAHTGPLTAQVVTVGGITASADPQVTHIWVFATVDTPLNTTSVFNFAAEITNGTTSWGDTLADSSLDNTRLAPWDNQPAPLGSILVNFQQCIGIAGQPHKPDLMSISGMEEITLGIPQMCFPISKFFNVPGGTKQLIGGMVYNNALWLATPDFYYCISGFSAETFAESDNIIQPGLAGKWLIEKFGTYLLWVSPDVKLRAWNGANEPVEVSWKIALRDPNAQAGMYLSMEDIDSSQLSWAQIIPYSYGRYNVVMLFAKTLNNANNTFDWIQLWDVSSLVSPAGPFGAMTEDGKLTTGAEADMFPSHPICCAGQVMVGNHPYVWLADTNKNVYRWPDGFQDAGTPYPYALGSQFSDLSPEGQPSDVLKRMKTLDVATDREDALNQFAVSAVATDGAFLDAQLVQVPTQGMAMGSSPDAPDPTVIRGMLDWQQGSAFGRYLRWLITGPMDALETAIYKVIVKYLPVSQR